MKKRTQRKMLKVGITMGDPSGAGPAAIIKALKKLKGFAEFKIIGDEWVLKKAASLLGEKLAAVIVVDLKNVPRSGFAFGKIRKAYGKASLEYIDRALQLIKLKEIDCLVTCPVSKEAVSKSRKNFRGHTEYLAEASGSGSFVMMLLNQSLKVSLVTRHLALKDVSSAISKKKVYDTLLLSARYLKRCFCIKEPHLSVCGLNPHASDNGLFGNEEKEILIPVIQRLKKRIRITGPISAEAALLLAKTKKADCAVAMYHDQALIALKLLAENKGANITLGLPFIRTSPLHGTAFDIAAKPKYIDPFSLTEAIKLAVKCALNLKKN